MTINEPTTSVLETLTTCCRALDDKKAADIRVLHLGEKSSITDYYIIASGTSEPHLKALKNAVEQALKSENISVLGVQSDPGSGWVVVDAYDVMIHLFNPEQRQHYSIEALWKDAGEVDVANELLLSA